MLMYRSVRRSLASRSPLRIGYRMTSTILGASGREYIQNDVPMQRGQNNTVAVYKAHSGDESFIIKRAPKSIYERNIRIANELADSHRLRLHIDHNQKECALVFPYFDCTLLDLIRDYPDFPPVELGRILRHVGEAIQELHHRDWIHLDVKANNILVNWTADEAGVRRFTNATLGDLDTVFKMDGGTRIEGPSPMGNIMWRSPEMQAARGVSKASDIFQFGLVCIFAFGGAENLLVHDNQELESHGITPERHMMIRHFCFFGPVPEGLYKWIDSDERSAALKQAAELADLAVKENPRLRFRQWGEGPGQEVDEFIAQLTNLDPAARPTIDQALAHPVWDDET